MRPKQETFAEASFERYRKPTRHEQFLAQMNTVMPSRKLTLLVVRLFKAGQRLIAAGRVSCTTVRDMVHAL